MEAISPIWFSAIVITVLNVVSFLIGYFQQSDKLTDITYSLSFFVVSIAVFAFSGADTLPQYLLLAMVVIWSIRLGSYLLRRIIRIGHDSRFDDMRPSLIRFFSFWALQIISIWVLVLPVVLYFDKVVEFRPGWHVAWGLVWLTGFLIETVADNQKYRFRNDPANKGKFVDTGLWSVLRHPNYTGEILCWVGIFFFVLPDLNGLELLSAISPIWIATLLIFISGIPLLEKAATKKYGSLPNYQTYLSSTKRLIPFVW